MERAQASGTRNLITNEDRFSTNAGFANDTATRYRAKPCPNGTLENKFLKTVAPTSVSGQLLLAPAHSHPGCMSGECRRAAALPSISCRTNKGSRAPGTEETGPKQMWELACRRCAARAALDLSITSTSRHTVPRQHPVKPAPLLSMCNLRTFSLWPSLWKSRREKRSDRSSRGANE